MENINNETLRELSQENSNTIILDVRTPEEWSDGIIENAQMINLYDGQGFIDEVNKLNKSNKVLIYCKSGGRSVQACMLMEELGFNSLYNLTNGITGWDGEVVNP